MDDTSLDLGIRIDCPYRFFKTSKPVYTEEQYIQFKPQKDTCNESETGNILNRQFQGRGYRDVVISDLTYVRAGTRWNYICSCVYLMT